MAQKYVEKMYFWAINVISKMIRGIIYMYTSPSGKSYIGQTVDERRRRGNWYSSTYAYAGDAINRARAKYGRDAFTYTVLYSHVFSTKEDAKGILDVMEKYYIQKYDTKKRGYNCEEGGGNHFGYAVSEEARKNISNGVRSWASTPEGRQKLSLAHKGKKKKGGYRVTSRFKPVVQLSLDCEYIREFPSMRDAEEFLYNSKIVKNRTNIGCVCNGRRDSAFGYKWMYKDDYYNFFLHPKRKDIPQRVQRVFDYIVKRNTPKIKKKYKHKYIPKPKGEGLIFSKKAIQIGQYGVDLHLIKVWRCAKEAAKALNICESNIGRASRTLGMYMGYYWRKYNGELIAQPKPKKNIVKMKLRKQIAQMDMDENILHIFNGVREASKEMGANNIVSISRCLNGKSKTAFGYKWKELNCA